MDNLKQLVTTSSTEKEGEKKRNRGGRPLSQKTVELRKTIRTLYLAGVPAIRMAEQKIANLNTIYAHIKQIQTDMLDKDQEWFTRARIARLEAEERLQLQLQRILTVIQDRTSDTKLRAYYERILTRTTVSLYNIKSSMDPEQWVDEAIKEKIEVERTRQEKAITAT